tara:strand:+ start:1070 stop:1504 length:435 start_codon:yes stop_codon:yes gene_type:complete
MTVLFLLGLTFLTIFLVWNFNKQLEKLKADHEAELKSKVLEARRDGKQRSAAVQWGKSIEHFVPFMEDFPIPVEDVTFIGMPIDYVGFTESADKKKCAVHFVEVKSGKSILASKQRNIRDAIKAGRVHWHEVSVEGNSEKELLD